ncbi:MAG TPA: hypothetical protein DCQ31_10815 [Bacteroidales bacterium]|nr:hypothetical protein [Bacteroidales bacterium]
MKTLHAFCFTVALLISISIKASYKVYIVHGLGGIGLELSKIKNTIEKSGFESEIYWYPSLVRDIDSVGKLLITKIRKENYDTISFVTHSLGGLVVRTLYEHIKTDSNFPFIHRIVMVAPPNQGSPVADFFVQWSLARFIVGPNLKNLTTNKSTGASRYPIPAAEVGVISGGRGKENGYNYFLNGDNDGVLLPEMTKMGIEKDVVFVKAAHVELVFNSEVNKMVVNFLKTGKFTSLVF